MNDFDYLGEGEVYLDGACQSLRPRPVIDAINQYYTEHNSCGERVKYKWGDTRKSVEVFEATSSQIYCVFYFKHNLRDKFDFVTT